MSAIDLSFDLDGGRLPADYPYALWDELLRLVPELGSSAEVGVIPLKAAASGGDILLPKRAKLALRLPHHLLDAALALSQQELRIAADTLRLGSGKPRAIQSYPTLHAHLVCGSADEIEFMAEVGATLQALNVKPKLICGRHQTLTDGKRSMSGFSLVLHDLTPEDSLRVQYAGLGTGRNFGCGLFVPYKVISGLE